jgi:D-amino peptidase
MKLLICADMEGVTGVTEWNHVSPSHAEYARFRSLLTGDVNAAVRGAFEAGATEIVVADGHNVGANVLIEELDPRARLIGGSAAPLAMVQGLEDHPDAAFFVGYHARNGTQNAILDHTWSSSAVADVWLNEHVTGEIGLNAAVCGHFAVPVLLLTGDQSAGAEAREWIPGVDTVAVKQAKGRMAAELLSPAVTAERIREAAAAAVLRFRKGQPPAAVQISTPVVVRIGFKSTDMVDRAALMPGSRRLDGLRLEFTAEDMQAAYFAFQTAVALA